MLVFWLLAAGMLAVAMLFLLPVLLRGSGEMLDTTEQENLTLARERLQELEQAKAAGEISEDEFAQEKQQLEDQLADDIAQQPAAKRISKQGRGLVGALLVVVPAITIVLYQYLGNPGLLQEDPSSFSQAVSAGHAEMTGDAQQLPSVDIMVARLADRLRQQPDDPEGWYMLARSYTVMQRHEEAIQAYERLQDLVGQDPGIQAEIAQLQKQMAREANVKAAEALPAIVPAKITVTVLLGDTVRGQVEPNDTVFILARAINGPPMPLAVVKTQVKDLPVTVELDDSQAMMSAMKLSSFNEVDVVARVSRSGSPMAQRGDLQGTVQSVKPGRQPKVSIMIDQKIP